MTPMPQTRNFFDHENFQSPGTHRFNENYANLYCPNINLHNPNQPNKSPEISRGNNIEQFFKFNMGS
jgi:hypothetical protein